MSKIDLHKLLSERGLNFSRVANDLSVDRSTVTRWAKRKVPAERVNDLANVTGIPAHELRPDIFRQPESA
jgi:DNA-binding transcriptional regulator YdaS (Cro superfamily)